MERELEPEFMDDAAEASSYDAMDHSLPNSAFVDRLVELGASGLILDLGCDFFKNLVFTQFRQAQVHVGS